MEGPCSRDFWQNWKSIPDPAWQGYCSGGEWKWEVSTCTSQKPHCSGRVEEISTAQEPQCSGWVWKWEVSTILESRYIGGVWVRSNTQEPHCGIGVSVRSTMNTTLQTWRVKVSTTQKPHCSGWVWKWEVSTTQKPHCSSRVWE